jgi:O-antigen/teichoic acid export membrane protein
MALGKLGFGGFGMTAVGLIVSTVAAPIVALGLTLRSRLWRFGKWLIHIEWQDIRKVAVEYKKFPIFSLPRALVNNIGTALPALLLVPAFGLGKMGLFSMAIMLSFTPITLIVNSVQQVLFQQVTERVHAGQPIRAMMRRITLYTLAGVVPFFALLYFPLPWMSGLLLGDEWRISGEYIRMMLPWLLMVCLNGPICFVADVFMAQGVGLIYECAILLARVAGLSVGIYLQRFDYAIMGYSVASTIVLIAQLVWYYRLIERYERTR